MRWRRLVRRLSFVFAAVLGVAALTPALAHGDTVDESHRPTVFAGIGAATGVHQEFNGNAGLAATVEPVHGSLPDGLVDFGSDVSRARAATYYPGATVAGLGELWCGQVAPIFPFPNPECPLPAFPTTVDVPTPDGKPDASTTTSQDVSGNGPVDFTASYARAHADRKYASSDAVDSGYDSNGTPAQAAAVLDFRRAAAALLRGPVAASAVKAQASDSSAAHADESEVHVRADFPAKDPSLLVITATAVTKGVSMFGGTVHVDSITTQSVYQTNGKSAPVHRDTVRASGTTVEGQSATIDQNGVTILGNNEAKPVLDALNAAFGLSLKGAGTTIRLVSPSQSAAKGGPPPALSSVAFGTHCSAGEADGVQYYQKADLSSVPLGQAYYTNITLGSACTDGYAGAGVGKPALPTVPAVTVPGAAPASPPAAGTSPSSGASETALPVVGTPQARATGGLAAFLTDEKYSLRMLYLALALACIGLALGWRVPSRLSRH